jgi:predicted lipid-binding transport protein (Tim44 family)
MEPTYLYPHDPDEPIEAFPPYSSSEFCPRCSSHQIETRNYATKTGCAVGAIAGISLSIASYARGARVGSSSGMFGGSLGIALGGIAAIVLDALASGAAGCTTGITIGQIVDRTLLRNHKCHQCGHTFNTH